MRGYRRPQSAWKASLWLKETRLPTFWTFGADETDTEMRTAFTNTRSIFYKKHRGIPTSLVSEISTKVD